MENIANQVLINQQCAEQLVKDWTTSYKQMLAWLKGKELSTADSTCLANIAMQCSDEYGDGVHVARAILGQYNETYYDSYDDCDGSSPGNTYPRSISDTNGVNIFSVSPNPNDGNMILNFNAERSCVVQVYSSSGSLLLYKEYKKEEQLALNIENYSGLIFIEISHDDFPVVVKKAMIIK